MEMTALVLGVLAFLIALKIKGELGLLKERLDRIEAANASSGGRAERQVQEALELHTQFLARLAAGEPLDPEQIREGRLWADADQARAIELLDQGVQVVDVRTPEETLMGILPGAVRIPVDDLPMRFGELGQKDTPTLVYCAMGARSAAAAQFLSEQGFTNVHNLDVGFGGWTGPKEIPDG